MRTLKNKGYKVIAVAPEESEYAQLLRKEFEFYPIKHLKRKGTNPFKDVKLLLEYISIFKKIKPDIVINFTIKPNIYGSIAARLLGVPSISTITGLGYVFIKKTWITKVVRLLYKITFEFNRAVIFLNIDDAQMLGVVPQKNIFLIESSGIDLELFNTNKIIIESEGIDLELFNTNKIIQVKRSAFIFLFVGRLLSDKGVYELIEAFKRLKNEHPNTKLIIIGDIDEENPNSLKKAELEQWAKENLIIWNGFQKDVRQFYYLSDCVVLPSYREGIPRVLLEAMAMKKPIITTDAPGCRNVCIDGVNGLLVKPKDVESLYIAMKKVVEFDSKKLLEMGVSGRKLVEEKYEISKIVSNYVKIIERFVNS
jgi:glycosyltransferase involved in cell wall biosynthesis